MAVHKSVGTYVDKAHRRPATAADCYIKKTGTFLPVPKHFDPAGRPLFSPSAPRGQQQYIEAADVTDAGKLLQAYL